MLIAGQAVVVRGFYRRQAGDISALHVACPEETIPNIYPQKSRLWQDSDCRVEDRNKTIISRELQRIRGLKGCMQLRTLKQARLVDRLQSCHGVTGLAAARKADPQ